MRHSGQHDVPAGGEISREPDERRGRPRQRRGGAGGTAVHEADRREGRVGAVGRRGQIRQLPVLLRNQADSGREPAHPEEQRRRITGVAGSERLLAPFRGQRRPEVPRALPARRPRPSVAPAVAVAVAVVAVPARPTRCRRFDRRVDDRKRLDDVRVVRGQLAEAYELEKAGVDHLTLVECRATVSDAVRDRRVRVTGLREPDEVRMRRERTVRRHRPALDRALPVVGDAEPDRGRRQVAVCPREVGGGDEACDLRRDRGRREAALLLPALGAERRAVRDEEVRGRLDVVRIQRRVGEAELLGHQNRVRTLVELRPERVWRQFSVDEAVPRHRAVRQLLPLEQEQRRVARGREVAGGDQSRPRLVEVAREHLAVGAEVRVCRVAGRDRLAPWRGEAGDDGTGERLVLGRLDHVGAEVVVVLELLALRAPEAAQLLRSRFVQGVVVVLPAVLVVGERVVEAGVERALGRADRLRLRRAEAQCEHRLAVFVQSQARRLHDVAVRGVRRRIGERM